MKNKYSIYKITNLLNGKVYIGKTTKSVFQDRCNEHFLGAVSLKRGRNKKPSHLQKAINKYGSENFKVERIISCQSEDILNQLETFFIKKFKSYLSRFGYNKTMGGEGNKHTLETIAKLRGENNPFYNKHHTDETKELMCKIWEERLADPNFISSKKGTIMKEESKKKQKETWDKNGGHPWESRNHKDESKNKVKQANEDRVYITNGLMNTSIRPESPIPNGWFVGTASGYRYINNGDYNLLILEEEETPYDWKNKKIKHRFTVISQEVIDDFESKGLSIKPEDLKKSRMKLN